MSSYLFTNKCTGKLSTAFRHRHTRCPHCNHYMWNQYSYYRWNQNAAEQSHREGKRETDGRYTHHSFLYPIPPQNGSRFFPETLCPSLSSRQQPVLSCLHPAVQSKARPRWKGWDVQKERADFCLKRDYSRHSRRTSKETLAAIGESIYLEHRGRVGAGQVHSAKQMPGKKLAARWCHPQAQPSALGHSAAPTEIRIATHRFSCTGTPQ